MLSTQTQTQVCTNTCGNWSSIHTVWVAHGGKEEEMKYQVTDNTAPV